MKSEHDTVAYRSGYDTGPTNPLPQVEIQLINDFFCKSSLFKLCSVLFCHLFGKLYVKFSSAYFFYLLSSTSCWFRLFKFSSAYSLKIIVFYLLSSTSCWFRLFKFSSAYSLKIIQFFYLLSSTSCWFRLFKFL